MRSQSYAEQAKAPRALRRELAIDSFSQAPGSSVWYYRVNVSVHRYEEVLMSTFIDEDASDDSSSEDDGPSLLTSIVEHYSILRRYSDFQQLYEQVRDVVAATDGETSGLPSLPAKELISPAWRGVLRRASSSKMVLEDRSAKFEALLQWLESQPVAKNCQAFVDFVGKPPQSHGGYVSLKEYTPPDWLSSLQQTTKGIESRRRRYSTGCSALHAQRAQSISEVSESLTSFRRGEFKPVLMISSIRGMANVAGTSADLVDRFSV